VREYRRIDLEELNLPFKHVDYLVDCGDLVVLVEETKRSKLEDLDKMEETINWLRSRFRPQGSYKILGIVHHGRGADPQLAKALITMTQRSRRQGLPVIYEPAGCDENLENIFSRHGISARKVKAAGKP